MKIKNNTILCVFALSTLAAGFGSCQNEDDVLNGLPHGSVPLVLGDVTVAGAQNVNNRAAGGNTRAAITEDPATGYTGIRKSRFVNGDVLNLTLTNGTGGSGGSTTSVTATLTGGKWVLAPGKVFITPGVTEISATHTATEQTTGIATDNLAAANADCTLTAATGTLSIAMKHAGAMIDITPGATDGATITSVTVNTDVPTAAEEEAVASGSGTTMHYRTLTADATVVSSISAVIGGTTYVATLATPLTVAANKRYPVALTFKHQTLTATPSAPQDWTDGGTVPIPGYDRIIDSPEELAQLGYEMDNNLNNASTANIIQTVDLDMSRLMTATEANAARPGKNYTYTSTADEWHSMGIGGDPFQGTYNGNGHTISNLKGGSLFYYFLGARITGIHLRNVQISSLVSSAFYLSPSPLVQSCENTIITLCSATGTVNVSADSNERSVGGLISECRSSFVTRCSADVDVTVNVEGNAAAYAGGLIGQCRGNEGIVASCSASGDVTVTAGNSDSCTGGLVGAIIPGSPGLILFACLATGDVSCLTNGGAFLGGCWGGSGNVSIVSCLATGALTGVNSNFSGYNQYNTFYDCAYTGTQTDSKSGITGNVAVNNLYATVINNNNYLDDVETLHWSAADGYTLTQATATWYAEHLWKDNGTAAPTIDMAYEGTPLYNSSVPNLLAIPGLTAYYVAPEDANAGTQWGNIDFSTVCPLGWHVPTKEEFANMTGLPADDAYHGTNNAAIIVVFPTEGIFWSSTGYDASNAWRLRIGVDGKAGVGWSSKGSSYRVRCVRKK